jgi:glycosyltransferase involved in cell wall biosynthesis
MLLRPIQVPEYIKIQQRDAEWFLNNIDEIRADISRISSDTPDVSIIVPAFNEEGSILRCLSSLSKSNTSKKVEILVVNNNSTDRTHELIEKSGAKCITEYKQGVKHARNSGLVNAKGKIILNADADSVYSPYWVDMLTRPLEDPKIACSFGRFSFLPDQPSRRFPDFLYETAGDLYKKIHQIGKDEAMYVYGCSSAYRRSQGIEVGGYDHPIGANEDGYLALKLRNKFGTLNKVKGNRSIVWTSNRRLLEQGGIARAFFSRVKNSLKKDN